MNVYQSQVFVRNTKQCLECICIPTVLAVVVILVQVDLTRARVTTGKLRDAEGCCWEQWAQEGDSCQEQPCG